MSSLAPTYNQDDYILVQRAQLNITIFGRITEIREDVVWYNRLHAPSEVKEAKNRSKYELIKSDVKEKDYVNDISKKIIVFTSLAEWLKNIREDKVDMAAIPYFIQQRKDKTVGLLPPIKEICNCGKTFNPDFMIEGMKNSIDSGLQKTTFEQIYKYEMVDCLKCKHMHHISCLAQNYSNTCAKCKKDMSGQLKQGIVERKRDKKSAEKKVDK